MRRAYADIPAAAKRIMGVHLEAEMELWQRVAQRLAHELSWYTQCDERCPGYGHGCPQEETDCGSMILAVVWADEEER